MMENADINVEDAVVEDTVILTDEQLSKEQRHARWQSKRPPIDHLKDGVVTLDDGSRLPLFDVGERIVVDRCTAWLPGHPWLETIVGKVRNINDETGVVSMWDEAGDARNPPCRHVSFKDDLHIFKLAPARGNPFEPPATPKQAAPPKEPGKRGRGRPKGSKNRPKDVIQAEKEARRAAKKGAM